VVDPGLQRLHALLEVAAETFTVVRVSECARGGWSIILQAEGRSDTVARVGSY